MSRFSHPVLPRFENFPFFVVFSLFLAILAFSPVWAEEKNEKTNDEAAVEGEENEKTKKEEEAEPPEPPEDVSALPGWSGNGVAYRVALNRGINPASADFLLEKLEEAQEAGAAAFIVELDTPGGLLESTRLIMQAFLASEIPTVVYVAPSGARAGSAGVFITVASHVAAMAPGTNIGAAHPVSGGGGDIEGDMGKKVENDAVANIRSVALQRGRNADWAEKAVRESDSITSEKALEINAIDLIAKDVNDLLAQANGRAVTLGTDRRVRLELEGVTVETLEPNFRQNMLSIVSDPALVFILMLLGALGLFIEYQSPGLIVPGVLGGVCLMVAFAVQTLPINWLGVVFMIAAIAFFIAEIYVTSFGILSIMGLISLFVGAYTLFDVPGSSYRVPTMLIITVTLLFAATLLGIGYLIMKTYRGGPKSGAESLVGEEGEISAPIGEGGKPGKVFFHGEYWDAVADGPIEEEGARVKVVEVNGMKLKVKRI